MQPATNCGRHWCKLNGFPQPLPLLVFLTEEAIEELSVFSPRLHCSRDSTETLFPQCHAKVSWDRLGGSISFQKGLLQSLVPHNKLSQNPICHGRKHPLCFAFGPRRSGIQKARGHARLVSALQWRESLCWEGSGAPESVWSRSAQCWWSFSKDWKRMSLCYQTSYQSPWTGQGSWRTGF